MKHARAKPLGVIALLVVLAVITIPRMAPLLAEGGGGSSGAITSCWPSSCGGCSIGGCDPTPRPYCYYVHCSECTCVCWWGGTKATVSIKPCPNVVN